MSTDGLAVVIPSSDVVSGELSTILSSLPSAATFCVVVQNADAPDPHLVPRAEIPGGIIVRSLMLPFRVGKVAAVRSGLSCCFESGDFRAVAQVDGHLKQHPSVVGDLWNRVESSEADLAILNRYKLDEAGLKGHRQAISTLLAALIQRISGVYFGDSACGTRVYSRALAEVYESQLTGFGYGLEAEQIILAADRGFQIAEVATPSNVQNEATDADKILDNLNVINTHVSRAQGYRELAIQIANAIKCVRDRSDFTLVLSNESPIFTFEFQYVTEGYGEMDAYRIATLGPS